LLAIANEIDVLFIDATGKPGGRLWSIKYGSISEIRRAQLEFLYSPKAVKWVKGLLRTKIDNQIGLLLSLDAENEEQKKALEGCINRLRDYQNKIEGIDSPFVNDIAPSLRGWEGAASRAYFATLNLFLPKEYQFGERTQHPAYDVFNCLLN
jgi:CRISPR-associated protein Cas1